MDFQESISGKLSDIISSFSLLLDMQLKDIGAGFARPD
jgi:hypothetical protein